jgi:uncharacterized membrane protein YfcA
MLLTISGFLIGFLVGLTGVGGGSLMTPLLILVFNVPTAVAVGTDLLYASITKCFGIINHNKNKFIDWGVVKILLIGSIPSSILTSIYLSNFDLKNDSIVSVIEIFLAVTLILTSLAIIFQSGLTRQAGKIATKGFEKKILNKNSKHHLTLLLGIILGVIVTFTSVGAGAIGVTILIILYPKFNIKQIVGTDLAHAVPLTITAGIGHLFLGNIDFNLLTTLLVGSIPGVWLGSKLNASINALWIKLFLIILLLLIAIRLLISNI